MKKLLTSFMAVLFVLVLPLQAFGSTTTSENPQNELFSPSEIKSIKKHMKEDGLSTSDINKVIKKIKRGEKLDSQKFKKNPKKVSKAQGIDLESFQPAGLNDASMINFEDGSYVKAGLKLVEKQSVTLKTDKDTTQSLSVVEPQATNGEELTINVWGSSPFSLADYYADVFISASPLYEDYIEKIYDPSIRTFAGTLNGSPDLKVIRKYDSSDEDAYARMYYFQDGLGDVSTGTNYLRLYIGDEYAGSDPYGIKTDFHQGGDAGSGYDVE